MTLAPGRCIPTIKLLLPLLLVEHHLTERRVADRQLSKKCLTFGHRWIDRQVSVYTVCVSTKCLSAKWFLTK